MFADMFTRFSDRAFLIYTFSYTPALELNDGSGGGQWRN